MNNEKAIIVLNSSAALRHEMSIIHSETFVPRRVTFAARRNSSELRRVEMT